MNCSQKNRMGAGDGLPAPETTPRKDKRHQVPSARKFATRGVVSSDAVKEKLREAIEQYSTPPETPLRQRSASMAEITPVSKSKCGESKHKKSASSCGVRTSGNSTPSMQAAGRLLTPAAISDKDKKMMDAARRVCHQLVLNAWRRRRQELATLLESRDRTQTQYEQLLIQVDVLQKLRESEASRRVDAANENHMLKVQVQELLQTEETLENVIEKLAKEKDACAEVVGKAHVQLMNERNNNQTLRAQRDNVEQALSREKQQVVILWGEAKKLNKRLADHDKQIIEHKNVCEQYENAIRMSEDKYVESLENYEFLYDKMEKLEKLNYQLCDEKHDLEEIFAGCRARSEKLDMKLHAMKKLLCTYRQQKKQLVDDNDELKQELERVRDEFKAQNERQWWIKTGEFLYQKFTLCAYMLFPAMRIPTEEDMKHLDVLQGSIAFGSL